MPEVRGPAHDLESKAQAIADASAVGVDRSAAAHGVTRRTIIRWRNEVEVNPALADLVRERYLQRVKTWENEAPAAIEEAIAFLRRAFKEADPKDARAIFAVAGAFKLLDEACLRRELITARLSQLGATGQSDRPALPAADEEDDGDGSDKH